MVKGLFINHFRFGKNTISNLKCSSAVADWVTYKSKKHKMVAKFIVISF
jgi:hypothetical protein